MGNKDEKTFADLFSSSTTEKEETTQTFSDILNNGNEEKKETSPAITFDSIFDKIPELEPETKENIDSNLSEPQEKETSELIKDTISSSDDDNDSPFFSNTPKETLNKIDIFEKNDEFEKKEVEEEKGSELNNFNPFFEETSEKESEETAESNKEDDLINQQKQEVLEENPFFGVTESTQIDLTLSNEEKDNNQSVEQTKEEKLDIKIDPFMNTEETKKEDIEQNPFFTKEEVQPIEEKNIAQPIVVEEKTDTKEESSSQQKTTEKKSTSPFFEEEQKNEENPFFQNQINLIENQIPSASSGNIDTTKSKHYNVKIVKKKEPLIKFILGVISYALFIWLLLIGITLLIYVLDIKIRAAKGDYSSPTFNAYVVLTGSMLPEIEVSDVVITKKVDAADLKEGDVITFASADSRFLGTIITHRIIKKNPKTDTEGYTFQTKGDNNNVADNALVPEKNIYGKVILKIPKLGYLQEFLASDGGWIIVILIPCLVVISYDIVKLAKGLKRKKYKNIKVQK